MYTYPRTPYQSQSSYRRTDNIYRSQREKREAQEREFLARQVAYEQGTLQRNTNVSSPAASSSESYDASKRWKKIDATRSEENIHSELTLLIKLASGYLQTKEELDMKRLENRLQTFVPESFSRDALAYGKSHLAGIAAGGRELKNFIYKALEARKLLEVKKIFRLAKGNDCEQALAQYMKEKTPQEREHTIKSVLDYFKHSRSKDSDIQVFNQLLKPYNREIVKVPKVETPVAIRQALRASFDGFFKFPNVESTDKNCGIGYSPAYEAFADPHHRGKYSASKALPAANYNWEANKAVQAIMHSANMSEMLPQIKLAAKQAMIPAEVLDNCTVSDIAHMLYKYIKKADPTPADNLSFADVNPNCTVGTRQKYWREFAADEEKMKNLKSAMEQLDQDPKYIADLLNNLRENATVTLSDADNPEVYRQPTVKLELHHGDIDIKDAGLLGIDNLQFDEFKGLIAVVGYNEDDVSKALKQGLAYGMIDTHGTFEHGADSEEKGFSYHLIHTDNVYMTAGLENNYRNEGKKNPRRKSYEDFKISSLQDVRE